MDPQYQNGPYQNPQPTPPSSVFPPVEQQPAPQSSPNSNYDFIINPEKPQKTQFSFKGNSSMVMRLIVALIGIFVLLILFVVIKALIAGSSGENLPDFIAVAQDQQELIHLVSNAVNGQNVGELSTSNQNFIYTTQLSITSAQSQLLAYLKLNGHTIGTKELNLKVSTAIDNEITGAIAASTYDQTFTQVMQSELTTYEQALSQTFKATSGPKGRALLNNQYSGAQLLLQQINSPDS